MDLEKLEALIDEYIASVSDTDGTEWYASYRNFAESVVKGDPLGFDEFEPFLVWLKRRLSE